MRDVCKEPECRDGCTCSWARRRTAMDALHARLTMWSAWLAGSAIVACAVHIVVIARLV